MILDIGISLVGVAIMGRHADPTLAALTLSASSLTEGSVAGTVVGAVQGKTAGSTLTLTDSAGNRFALSGGNIVAGSVATDYETATSHTITIRETLAGATNTPRDTVLTITIINALEVTLSALTLTAATVDEDAAVSDVVGAVVGKTSGSSLAMTGNAGGQFALSGTNVVVASALTVGSHDITLRETHVDATNSPRDSVIAITVEEVVIPVPANTVAPAITGDLVDGETVSLSAGTWDPEPDEVQREWLADDVVVGSGTSLSLAGREGETLSARVRARLDGGEWSEWEQATGGGEVEGAPAEGAPVNLALPAITGDLAVGSELMLDVGIWAYALSFEIEVVSTNPTETLLSRQSATGATIGTLNTTEGSTLTLRVWATGPGGTTYAESEGFGPIEAAGDQWIIGIVMNSNTEHNPTPGGSPVTWTLAAPNAASNAYDAGEGWGFVGSGIDGTLGTTNFSSQSKGDVRLNGRWGTNANPTQLGLRIDVPEPGTYQIYLGIASTASFTPQIDVRDGPAHTDDLLLEIKNVAITNSQILDASLTPRTVAEWQGASIYGGAPAVIEVTGNSIWVGRGSAGSLAPALSCVALIKVAEV